MRLDSEFVTIQPIAHSINPPIYPLSELPRLTDYS
jgi:hypothetical protein